jgi:excisionase family DNA binding protein
MSSMEYITAAEAAEKWGVTIRQVQRLIAAERIPHTKRYGRSWLISADAEKPGDPRRVKLESPEKSLLSDLADVVTATTLPMSRDNPDAIMDTVGEERLRLHYEGELAYLRGDFERTKNCFGKTDGDTASRLRASSIAIAAAISTGDYPFYLEVEAFLQDVIKTNTNNELSVFAELCLSNAHVSAFALNMVPEWLKAGDFTALMPQAMPDAAYKRAKYFQFLGQYESMLAVAETALALCASKSGVTFHDIYFRAVCVMACCALRRADEAKRRLLDALEIALPHGFITPFAESATAFGGLLEQCLEQKYPQYYDTAIKQWTLTFTNWRAFHNRFTKDNITLILSLRDYQIAQLAVRGVPYKKIAEQFHMSLGTLNNKMQMIYETLLIFEKPRRQTLAKYIW